MAFVILSRGLQHVRGKVANLIQRIPGRHLQNEVIAHVGNAHGYAKNVPVRMGQRNRVFNRGVRRGRKVKQGNKNGRDGPRAKAELHALNFLAGAPRSCSFPSSLPHNPSKLPLDMTSTRSPGCVLSARYSAISSAVSNPSALCPAAVIVS